MLRKECAFFRPYLRDLPATLDHPLVRQVYPAGQATRLERLWAAREALLARVEDLPHTFCHLDAIRRNLHRCEGTEGRRVVAFDWEWAGIGALGEDLAPLVAGSLCMGDAAAASGRRLDAAAFTGYIDGLRDAGWRGDPAEVRFAYCAALRAALRAVGRVAGRPARPGGGWPRDRLGLLRAPRWGHREAVRHPAACAP